MGYSVFCSGRVLKALSEGANTQLIIETHVREDHIHLYGFPDTVERDWFRLLATVQGVGNKTALAILSAYAPSQLTQAIVAKDIAAFKAISGIGPKLAERIVTELKDKVMKMPTSEFVVTGGNKKAATAPSVSDDVVSALVNLGYSRSEAYAAAVKAAQNAGVKANLDALIKLSLKELMRA